MRIHVKGVPEHLRKQDVADKIRALLLSGIRSALLWQQLGGRRWHLFVYKKRIRDCVTDVRRRLITVH
jgi:high frequency lysogenization protein